MNKKQYRVLIVDDEEKDRSVVRILLQRYFEDLFDISEAKNANEAKKVLACQPIDLLMVDIQMPGMSGLDLVKETRDRNMRMYVMILTAFDYFEYAKEAIRYQVNDFMLKPPMRKEFYEAIQRFIQWTNEENDDRQMEEKSQKVFIQELGDCIILNADPKKIDAYKNLLNIREDHVFCILIDTSVLSQAKSASFQDEIEAAMNAYGEPYAMCQMKNQTAIFCFVGRDTLGYDEFSVTVSLKLSLNLPENTNIAVGNAVSLYDNPSESYRQALNQLNHLSHVQHDEEQIADKVITGIRSGEIEKAIRMFAQYLLNYGEQNSIDALMLKDIEILMVVRNNIRVREEKISLKMVEIFSTGSLNDIIHFSSAYLREIIENSSVCTSSKKHYVIRRICKRVEEHVEEPWSINDLAKEYGFNPFYLSRLFKEETNLCFTDYLTEKRLEKAIELMADTDLTIGEIGLAVGYNDQNYFSRVFKKKTQVGPREYRRMQNLKREKFQTPQD